MDVERALIRRHRHFVEVSADGRQRRRMIGVLARRDAEEIALAEPGRCGLDRKRRPDLDELLALLYLQLDEPFGHGLGTRESHVLQMLVELRSGSQDLKS